MEPSSSIHAPAKLFIPFYWLVDWQHSQWIFSICRSVRITELTRTMTDWFNSIPSSHYFGCLNLAFCCQLRHDHEFNPPTILANIPSSVKHILLGHSKKIQLARLPEHAIKPFRSPSFSWLNMAKPSIKLPLFYHVSPWCRPPTSVQLDCSDRRWSWDFYLRFRSRIPKTNRMTHKLKQVEVGVDVLFDMYIYVYILKLSSIYISYIYIVI